jgi:hypothetical protein
VTVGLCVIHTFGRDYFECDMLPPAGSRYFCTLIYRKFLKSLELHVWIETGMRVYTLEFNAPFRVLIGTRRCLLFTDFVISPSEPLIKEADKEEKQQQQEAFDPCLIVVAIGLLMAARYRLSRLQPQGCISLSERWTRTACSP